MWESTSDSRIFPIWTFISQVNELKSSLNLEVHIFWVWTTDLCYDPLQSKINDNPQISTRFTSNERFQSHSLHRTTWSNCRCSSCERSIASSTRLWQSSHHEHSVHTNASKSHSASPFISFVPQFQQEKPSFSLDSRISRSLEKPPELNSYDRKGDLDEYVQHDDNHINYYHADDEAKYTVWKTCVKTSLLVSLFGRDNQRW